MVNLSLFWKKSVIVAGAVVNSAALVFSQIVPFLPPEYMAVGATIISIATAVVSTMKVKTPVIDEIQEEIAEAVEELRETIIKEVRNDLH